MTKLCLCLRVNYFSIVVDSLDVVPTVVVKEVLAVAMVTVVGLRPLQKTNKEVSLKQVPRKAVEDMTAGLPVPCRLASFTSSLQVG